MEDGTWFDSHDQPQYPVIALSTTHHFLYVASTPEMLLEHLHADGEHFQGAGGAEGATSEPAPPKVFFFDSRGRWLAPDVRADLSLAGFRVAGEGPGEQWVSERVDAVLAWARALAETEQSVVHASAVPDLMGQNLEQKAVVLADKLQDHASSDHDRGMLHNLVVHWRS